jgi:hypothetical protein
MRTGEGKTLDSVLPAFLNALTGKGVHVVTVNDYLAKRDSEWVGQVHKFLGLEVGLVQQGLSVSKFQAPKPQSAQVMRQRSRLPVLTCSLRVEQCMFSVAWMRQVLGLYHHESVCDVQHVARLFALDAALTS